MGARICIVSTVHRAFDPRIFQKQARTLARAGFDVVLIAQQDATAPDATVADATVADATVADTDGVEVLHQTPPASRIVRMLLGPPRAGWLAWRQRADLYAVHDPELLPVAALLRLLTGRPVIYDAHEDMPAFLRTKDWLPRWLQRCLPALFRAVECACLRVLDGVVIAEASYTKSYDGVALETVFNYPLLTYADLPAPPAATRPTLIYAGALDPTRGLFEMIELVRRLRAERPDVVLQLVGPVWPDVEARLRTVIADHDLGDHVELVGRVSHRKVRERIAAAHVGLALLHPVPNHVDSLPTKLFEYMLMRLPVVVSDVPLWRAVVDDAGCGVAVDPFDVEAATAAVDGLLADDDRRRAMGARGRDAVLTRYGWDTQGDKLVAFYRSRLARGAA